MYATLICAGLALAQNTPQPGSTPRAGADNPSIDGNWTVMCVEKNGQPVPDAQKMTVHVKNNTITCTGGDGKPAMTWRLEFGPQATVRVAEVSGDRPDGTSRPNDAPAKSGVYVLSKDYLAICIHDAPAGGSGVQPAGGTPPGQAGEAAQPQSKSHCTIILKREGGSR